MAKNSTKLQEDSKPFYFKKGRTGVLLIHGFTGTPYIFREIGPKLAETGYTVSAPLLAGHGTKPEDLEKTTWQDWYRTVKKAYRELKKTCKDVFVVGASFGANLACYLAIKHEVKGLVLIGTPRWIYRHALATIFTPIFQLLGIRYYNKPISKLTNNGLLLGGPNYSYLVIPVRSVAQFLHVINRVTTKILPQVKAPALIIQSSSDGLIKSESGTFIFETIGSENKQLVWISEPHHELHTGKSRRQIYGFITEFIVRWK